MASFQNSKLAQFDSPEIITSLLYASSISAMLSLSIGLIHSTIDIATIVNTFLIIFLVFADWNNRVIIPLAFPIADLNTQRKPIYQFSKLAGEIVSMVFLVVFYSYFIKENFKTDNEINIYFLFSLYLIACWLWNLIMIKIMQGIDILPLVRSLFTGKVIDLEDLKDYTKIFLERIENKETEINNDHKQKIENNEETDEAIKDTQKRKRNLQFETSSARFIAQLIGNHIVWVNFFAAAVFFLKTKEFWFTFNTFKLKPFGGEIDISYIVIPYFILFVSIILMIVFFMKLKRRGMFYGSLLIFTMVLTYSLIGQKALIYLMILQQILIGILIGYITNGKSNLIEKSNE